MQDLAILPCFEFVAAGGIRVSQTRLVFGKDIFHFIPATSPMSL